MPRLFNLRKKSLWGDLMRSVIVNKINQIIPILTKETMRENVLKLEWGWESLASQKEETLGLNTETLEHMAKESCEISWKHQ